MQSDLDSFIQSLKSERYYSPHTCANYRRDLEVFADYLKQQGIEPGAMRVTGKYQDFRPNSIAMA